MSSVVPGFMVHDVNRSSTRVHAGPGGNSSMGSLLQDPGYESQQYSRQREKENVRVKDHSYSSAAGIKNAPISRSSHENIFQFDMLSQGAEPEKKNRFSGRSNQSSDIFNTQDHQQAPPRRNNQQMNGNLKNNSNLFQEQMREQIEQPYQRPPQQYSRVVDNYADELSSPSSPYESQYVSQASQQQMLQAQRQYQQAQLQSKQQEFVYQANDGIQGKRQMIRPQNQLSMVNMGMAEGDAQTSIKKVRQPPGGRSSGPLW